MFTVSFLAKTHAVVTVRVGLPVATPFETSAKFTCPGDAETEIESPRFAAKFTPAMFDRTCAAVGNPQVRRVASRIQGPRLNWPRPAGVRRVQFCARLNDAPGLDWGTMLFFLLICFKPGPEDCSEAANPPPRPVRVVVVSTRPNNRPLPWD